MYLLLLVWKPFGGTSGAFTGGFNRNFVPSGAIISSVFGLKDKVPANPNATTISGLAMKFIVPDFPSLRRGKFLL